LTAKAAAKPRKIHTLWFGFESTRSKDPFANPNAITAPSISSDPAIV